MPLSVQENSKTRVWDDIGPKIVAVLQKAGVESDIDVIAEEIFERAWPDIFKEVLAQANGMLEEGVIMSHVAAKRKSHAENE